MPAGGPFIVLLPAGRPFIFLPLVVNASVTAGGSFVLCSAMLDVTADVVGSLIFFIRHSWRFVAGSVTAVVLCHSWSFSVDRDGRTSSSFSVQCVRPVNFNLCMTNRNSTGWTRSVGFGNAHVKGQRCSCYGRCFRIFCWFCCRRFDLHTAASGNKTTGA